MRKATGIFLLVSLAVPFLALYVRNHVEIRKVRKEVKEMLIEGLAKDDLEYLSFSITDTASRLKWKHAHEFEFEGQMYDVVETIIAGDSIHYWCWWDHEETQLHRQLDRLMTNLLLHDPLQQSKQHKITDFFKNLYFEKHTKAQLVVTESNSCFFFEKTLPIYLFNDSPPAPPPWPVA